jgi:hypothetical protein
MSVMFIDALTPREPVPTVTPQLEHGGVHLGITAAGNDVHARVHGDGSRCPVCLGQVSSPRGAFPDPVSAVSDALGAAFHLR